MKLLTTASSPRYWFRVLLAGAAVAFLTLAFVYLAIYAYVVLYPVFGQNEMSSDRLGLVVAFVGGWGARFFFLIGTVLATLWIERKLEEKAAAHGVLVGLIAVASFQTLVFFVYPPVTLQDLSIYVILGLAGGLLGSVFGRTTLAGEVYRASQQIGRAGDSADVAAAIGEHLGAPGIHGVTLWRLGLEENAAPDVVSEEETPNDTFLLWASWTIRGEDVWPHDASLSAAKVPALTRLGERPSIAFRVRKLPHAERENWERRGIRSILLIPLVAPSTVSIGLLMVTFRKRRRFSRSLVRAYLTVAAQAALALENLRLVEAARQAGQQAGVLVERQRLAREIHDTLAQGFTSIIMSLTAAEMTLTLAPKNSDSVQHLEEARRTARENLAEARRLVWALRPESLERRSLSEALDRLVREWSKETGIEGHAVATGVPRPLLPEAEVAFLRTAQEALANVRKHAHANRVNITLSYMNRRAVLDVLDDGVGFDPARLTSEMAPHDKGGFGLAAMRERVEQLGGELNVESTAGEGTTIVVALPFAADGFEAVDQTLSEPQGLQQAR